MSVRPWQPRNWPTGFVFEAGNGESERPYWLAFGGNDASAKGTLAGDGTFAYAMIGRDLTAGETSMYGLSIGLEYGSWAYET